MEALKFAYHGETKVKLEEDVTKVAPVSAKAPMRAKPPPAPPSTLSSDRSQVKGGGEGDSKGKDSKRKGSKGKGDSEGNDSKGKSDNEGGKH